MHRHLLVAASIFLVGLMSVGASAEADVLVIRNVNVIPMDGERVLPDRTVIIRGDRIAAIQEGGAVLPSGPSRLIDGRGKYLMPGLAEMHAHVPGSGQPEQYRHDVLFLYLANGITLIRGMAGDPVHLELREQLRRGELIGPRLIAAGPAFNLGTARTPAMGAELARQQKAAGYDFIKVASGSRETYDAMVASAREVGIKFAGHVPAQVGVLRALEAGHATIDHLDGYMETLVDPGRLAGTQRGFFGYLLAPFVEEKRIIEMARKTRDAGVWNVPTETLLHAVLIWDLETIREERPEFRYLPPSIVDGWMNTVRSRRADPGYDRAAAEAFVQVRLDLILALHREGAGLLLGSDAPQFFNVPGFSIHPEMELMGRAGLTPYEVLETGTVKPAIFFGEEASSGKVAEGMRADLLLLEANPLEDLAHVRKVTGVIHQGKWLPKEEIDRRLEEIARRHARP